MVDQPRNLVGELKKRGYKITRQREAILRVYARHPAKPVKAQDLFEQVVAEHPGTNFSTVYRNLEMLVQEGLLLKVEIDGGAAHYELSEQGEHHHHLICKGCGSIQPTRYCPFKSGLAEEGFYPVAHRFEVYGYCRDCLLSGQR